MRLIDAFRSLPEQEAMRKPARYAIVYDTGRGQIVGGMRSARPDLSAARELTHWIGRPRFIIKVTPK